MSGGGNGVILLLVVALHCIPAHPLRALLHRSSPTQQSSLYTCGSFLKPPTFIIHGSSLPITRYNNTSTLPHPTLHSLFRSSSCGPPQLHLYVLMSFGNKCMFFSSLITSSSKASCSSSSFEGFTTSGLSMLQWRGE